MNVFEWLTSFDSGMMCGFISDQIGQTRRLSLCALAIARTVWEDMSPKARKQIVLAEQFADGEAHYSLLSVQYRDKIWTGHTHGDSRANDCCGFIGSRLLQRAIHIWDAQPPNRQWKCHVMRDVMGPGFEPVHKLFSVKGVDVLITTDAKAIKGWCNCAPVERPWVPPMNYRICPKCMRGQRLVDSLEESMVWRKADSVQRLAQAIYKDHLFDVMPVLADALEEAGCTDQFVLRHCRGECPIPWCRDGGWFYGEQFGDKPPFAGRAHYSCPFAYECHQPKKRFLPHVRGCWVIDMLLGK